MSKNPVLCNGQENEKVIRNPHTDPDHHEKLITITSLVDVCSAFVSYPVYRLTDWTIT